MQREDGGPDLREVLKDLGHTPESFGRFIGRNTSGFRRGLDRGRFGPDVSRDIVRGLERSGYEGDPWRIKELQGAARPASQMMQTAQQSAVTVTSDAAVKTDAEALPPRYQTPESYDPNAFYKDESLQAEIAAIIDRRVKELREQLQKDVEAYVEQEVQRRVTERAAETNVNTE